MTLMMQAHVSEFQIVQFRTLLTGKQTHDDGADKRATYQPAAARPIFVRAMIGNHTRTDGDQTVRKLAPCKSILSGSD